MPMCQSIKNSRANKGLRASILTKHCRDSRILGAIFRTHCQLERRLHSGGYVLPHCSRDVYLGIFDLVPPDSTSCYATLTNRQLVFHSLLLPYDNAVCKFPSNIKFHRIFVFRGSTFMKCNLHMNEFIALLLNACKQRLNAEEFLFLAPPISHSLYLSLPCPTLAT